MPRGDLASTNDARPAPGRRRRGGRRRRRRAGRRLDAAMTDRLYHPRMLTGLARRDLADVRDRITTILGSDR